MAPIAGVYARISRHLQESPMAIKQVKSVADIPSEELDDWGPVEMPISEQVSQLRGRIVNEHEDGSEAGI
jgi:hypothetical protein